MATTPLLNLSPHSHLSTPARLADRQRDGKEPAAELVVLIPHGKTTRAITVDLNEDELLLLAEKALEAARVLRTLGVSPRSRPTQ